MKKLTFILLSLLMLIAGGATADACSRVVYIGDKGPVLVGRTLDWRTPIPTNIYVYPRGMAKTSMPTAPSLSWTSKYGSVLAVGYDGGVTEGMNDQGLVMNGLFCKGTIYRTATGSDNTPVMSLAVLVSYFLDNFASVDEVKTWLAANDFAIFGQTFDGGTVSALHWAITDKTGNTLLMEYVDGKLTTYEGSDIRVLTNDPPYPQMTAINDYWKKVGGVNMLPGTVRSQDRFVRASFFINHVPSNVDYDAALGSVMSIMGNVAVPYGYEIETEPNVSSTQWTSIADATNGRYYFHLATCPGYFWIDLGQLILHPGAPVLKFDTAKNAQAMGDVTGRLEKSAPFTPMW
ncbi:MAG: linear amide C-N hydrolase [Muribaculaceae bacterium]|nr:linear amide C-N hydrolase [Muribaculaceae bacterium]